MEILKPGRENINYEGRCDYCGCKLRCSFEETTEKESHRYFGADPTPSIEKRRVVNCPTKDCHSIIWLSHE